MRDIPFAGKLLEDLREAYRCLPRQIQVQVICAVRERAAGTIRQESCALTLLNAEGAKAIFKARLRKLSFGAP